MFLFASENISGFVVGGIGRSWMCALDLSVVRHISNVRRAEGKDSPRGRMIDLTMGLEGLRGEERSQDCFVMMVEG